MRNSIFELLRSVSRPSQVALIALLLMVMAGAAAHPTSFAAAAPAPPAPVPAARTLALPARDFPPGATLAGKPVSNHDASLGTGLHTLSLAQLGRVEGFEQRASWQLPATNGRMFGATVQYESSIFSTAGGASDARADAQASLWERGQPLPPGQSALPGFILQSHAGSTSLVVVLAADRIETELVLTYGPGAGDATIRTALRQFTYLWRKISLLNSQIAAAFPGPPATTTALPDLFAAPPGTGPVVKSPSLMVVSASTGGVDSFTLDGGVFRPVAPLPLSSRTTALFDLVPAGMLSRYIQLAGTPASDRVYDSASLFPDADAARVAYDALVRSNNKRRLTRERYDAVQAGLQRLASVDAMHIWRYGNEVVLVTLVHNVVMVLAERGSGYATLPGTVDSLLSTVPSWLHADGTEIVDESNTPIRLSGLNWYGAEGPDFVVGGLDYNSYQSILWMIKNAGYNTIRLPFSNALVEGNPVVTSHLQANPELSGLHALDILDRIIGYAGALGISVILDDHRSDAGWSSQESGLWYTPAFPESAFDADWATLAQRYAGATTVVGADLRNEPHGPARWGNGDPATDWKMAAQRAGNAVLASNPHLLILVEGVQFYGAAPGYWWGGNLMGVATAPISLQFADGTSAHDQLVYSTHDYGVDNCNGGCPWFNATTSYDSLAAIWDRYWGYITDDPTQSYASPVLVGEFGTCNYSQQCVADTTPGSQGQWFESLLEYIDNKHLSWAYWSANGTESTGDTRTYGALDWYGYFTQGWTADVPWISEALRAIQDDTAASTSSHGN